MILTLGVLEFTAAGIFTFLALSAVSAGLSYLASYLLRPKSETAKAIDDQTTPLTTRGSYIPVVLGRRRIPPLFAWVGDRKSVERGNSGKGGGGGGATGTTYYESAWHPLCVGPGTRLIAILREGKQIFPGKDFAPTEINSTTTPSGTNVALGDRNFDIYWGELNQPINEYLGEAEEIPVYETQYGGLHGIPHQVQIDTILTGKRFRAQVQSRWPRVMYIVWRRYRLGGFPRWPQLTYEVFVPISQTGLTLSSAYIAESSAGAEDDGVNPAHALYQLLVSPPPRGAGIDAALIDLPSLEAVGQLCVSEHLAFNIFATDGVTAADKCIQMMSEAGIMCVFKDGKLFFKAVRKPVVGETKVLTDDVLVGAYPSVNLFAASFAVDRVVYTYKDREAQYKDMDVKIDDDSQAIDRGGSNAKRQEIASVTDKKNALKVADRLIQQDFTHPAVVTFKATREARSFLPGDVVQITGIGIIRLLNIEKKTTTGEVQIEGVNDPFQVSVGSLLPPTNPDSTAQPVKNDDSFDWIELPYEISPLPAIGVFRDRAHAEIEGAIVYFSSNDTAYYGIGTQNPPAIRIMILDDMFADGQWINSTSSRFQHGGDIEQALDLSGDDESWGRGRQMLIMGNEIMFVRSISALGNDTFRLNDVIRGRFDTSPIDHDAGDYGYLVDIQNVAILRDSLVVKGVTLSVKTQPFTEKEIADISTVTPVTKLLTGRAEQPFPPDNFRGNDSDGLQENQYVAAGAVVFEWSYRVKTGQGAAAGEALAGAEIDNSITQADGDFILEIFDAAMVLKQTLTVAKTLKTYTATNANLKIWLGNPLPASFYAKLHTHVGSLDSDSRQILLTRTS